MVAGVDTLLPKKGDGRGRRLVRLVLPVSMPLEVGCRRGAGGVDGVGALGAVAAAVVVVADSV